MFNIRRCLTSVDASLLDRFDRCLFPLYDCGRGNYLFCPTTSSTDVVVFLFFFCLQACWAATWASSWELACWRWQSCWTSSYACCCSAAASFGGGKRRPLSAEAQWATLKPPLAARPPGSRYFLTRSCSISRWPQDRLLVAISWHDLAHWTSEWLLVRES